MERILEIIKKARESKGLTQTDVAAKLGIGLRQYQNIESGQFPKYKRQHIQALDSLLGINVYEEIYEGIDEIVDDLKSKEDASSFRFEHDFNLLDSETKKYIVKLEADKAYLESKVLRMISDIKTNLTDTKEHVLLNQAIGRAALVHMASMAVDTLQRSDKTFLKRVQDQNKSIEDFLRVIYQQETVSAH